MKQKADFSPKKNGYPIFLALSWLVALFSLIAIVFQVGGLVAYNLAPIFAALLSVYAGFEILRFNKMLGDRKIGKFHLIFAGLVLWAIAEGVWMIYDQLGLGEDIVVSWADLFWYSGYIFFILFLFARLLPILSNLSFRGKATYCVSFLATMLASWYAITWLILPAELSRIELVAAIAYVLLDTVVLFLVGSAIVFFRGGSFAKAHLLTLTGFAAFIVSDIFYYYLGALGIYATGNLIDLGWVFGYLLIGVGEMEELSALKKTI